MGRLNRGPNGPFSGKAGSVIGSSWRDIYYIKGLQKRSTKERGPLQIASQEKFRLAVKFLAPVKSVLDIGFSKINPGGATGYNMGLSHTLQHVIKGTYPDLEIDYTAALFAVKGSLSVPGQISMERNEMNLKLSWNTDCNRGSFIDDQVEILIYQPGVSEYQILSNKVLRMHGELEIGLDPDYDGDTVHVFLYMITSDFKKWSNSIYVGPLKFR